MRRGAFWILLFVSGCSEPGFVESQPGRREDPAYVADLDCASCHADETRAWNGSHHDLAMQEATPETVLGDFDDATFGEGDASTRFFRRGDRFLIQTAGRDGKRALFEVPFVFGVEPLQQLLVAFPGGRLQSFPIAWDTRPEADGGQRWFHLTPEHVPAAGDPFHWTGVYQTWNHQCASCHSTAVQRGFDEDSDTYTTSWVEIDVGCQACHGAGAAHVAWANGEAGEKRLASVTNEAQIDACGPCHARRSEIVPDAVPGGRLLDSYLPATPLPPLYYPDGQIRDEVYVLGSFLQSKMHAAGVACSDCHDPHRAAIVREGNALCLGCHGGAPPARFAARLAGGVQYDSPDHHHHAAGSEGAQCVACHMPARTYMGVDARRDHAFRIPRPALAARSGAPDACTSCHSDETPAFAIRAFEAWGIDPDEAGGIGPALAAGSLDALRETLRGEPRPLVRAASIDWLGQLSAADPEALELASDDSDPLVRTHAARASASLEPPQRAKSVAPLLEDPVRAVRLEAARALAEAPAAELGERAAARDALLEELVTLLRASADTPAAHLQLGELAERRGQDPDAHYRAALFLDPGLEPAARHAARRLAVRRQLPGAESILRRALEANPESGALSYDLGLLLAESNRREEAVEQLARAADQMPGNPRVFYNLGLLLEQLDQKREAEAVLMAGLRGAPDDPDLLYALVAFHGDLGNPAAALGFAERLVAVAPNPETLALLQRIRSASSAGR